MLPDPAVFKENLGASSQPLRIKLATTNPSDKMKQHSIQQNEWQFAGAANISWYFNQSLVASDLAASG